MDKQDQINFLSIVVFGKKIEKGNNLPIFCQRAYRDLCRTIQFNDKPHDGMRMEVQKLFEQEFCCLSSLSLDEFDDWHKNLCEGIIEICQKYVNKDNEKDPLFSYGQAQKWVNMTLKYFYIFDDSIVRRFKNQLHVPVDRIVIKAAKKELGIDAPEVPWSKWNADSYNKFQSQLREKIGEEYNGLLPIEWEYSIWNKSSEETPSNL